MAVTDKMTPDEFAIYSAINHADDEWTPEATEALNRIKEKVWDEGHKVGRNHVVSGHWNPYR